ncbi:hypothetical protein AB0I54_39505 [Streptomyces sp. NPDC050625]
MSSSRQDVVHTQLLGSFAAFASSLASQAAVPCHTLPRIAGQQGTVIRRR